MADADWYDLAPVAEIARDSLHARKVAGRPLCFGRAGETYFAVDALCPHAGGDLSTGTLEDELLVCPLHGYAYEIRSGHCPDEPSCSIRSYEVCVEDGVLRARL